MIMSLKNQTQLVALFDVLHQNYIEIHSGRAQTGIRIS